MPARLSVPRGPHFRTRLKRWRLSNTGSVGAFTLVELLVVVAGIAVLAALLLPTIKGVMEKSKDAQCVSNLRQIHSGFLAVVTDNEGQLRFMGNQEQDWHRSIHKLHYGTDVETTWRQNPNKYIFRCPRDTDVSLLSYGLNGLLVPKPKDKHRKPLAALPSRVILAGDKTLPTTFLIDPDSETGWGNPAKRHNNGCDNFVFMDGHVETRPYPNYKDNEKLWNPNLEP